MGRADVAAVLLDAGNTLIGMDPALLGAVLHERGIGRSEAAVLRAEAAARPVVSRLLSAGGSSEGQGTRLAYVRAMLEALGLAPRDVDAHAPAVLDAVGAVGSPRLWSRVLPGVPEALAALRRAGLKLAVVSNADGRVEEILVAVGLRPLVDAVLDSTHVGCEKPDPRIFALALDTLGVAPARAVHVGDLYAVDVLGARAAGVTPVLLDPFGDWPESDCARHPDLASVARWLLGEDRA